MRQYGKLGVAGSIPAGGIYFHMEFFVSSRSWQLGEAHKNETKLYLHPE